MNDDILMSVLIIAVLGLWVMFWHYRAITNDKAFIAFYFGLVMVVFVAIVVFDGIANMHAGFVLGTALLVVCFYGVSILLRYHDERTRNGRRVVNRDITLVDRIDRVLDKILS